MALGLVLIAMLGAIGVTATLFVYDFPLWIVVLAYPLTGIILLPGVALVGWIRQNPPAAGPDGLLTSRDSAAAPHSQFASRILKSLKNDRLRS